MNKDIILIFGGDGKIAQAIVRKYLDLNCVVIAVDKKEKNDNTEFNKNENYHYFSTDITSVDKLTDLYNKLHNKFGYVNHIISAAGGPAPSEEYGLFKMSFKDIDASIRLNISSHIYIAKIFLPLLQKSTSSNKSILVFSSVNALKCFNLPAYSAAKSGIYGFMNCMVRPLGKEHIRINTISPGTVATKEEVELKEKFWGYPYRNMMALQDFTYPEDIAEACFSLTHLTKAITGQNLVVDSGQIV